MKTKIEVALRPFAVPNFVLVERPEDAPGGELEGSSYPLSALDPYTLDAMCSEFREAVFAKAKKQQPPQPSPMCSKCGRSV